MNKPIEIVLNAATIEYVTATWKDLSVADGTMTIGERYSFPWKKLFNKDKKVSVPAATGAITLTPTAPAAGTEYGFTIVQYVADVEYSSRIGYVAVAGDTATTVCNNLRTILTSMVNAGRLDVALTGTATCIITSTTTNPLISVGGLDDVGASALIAGTAGVNEGATLLAEGVKDSFDATVPTAGASYTSYELTLMMPKGSGGFNEQTSDQEHTLMLYVDQAGTPSGHFIVDLDRLLNGLNATNNTVTGLLSELLAV